MKFNNFTKWLITIFLLATLSLSLNLFITGFVIVSDGVDRYVYLRSVVVDGDLDFSNEYFHYNNSFSPLSPEQPRISLNRKPFISSEGYSFNEMLIGNAYLWFPFFIFASIFSLIVGLPIDGYNQIFEFMIGFGSIFYAMLGLFICYLLLKRYYKEKIIVQSLLILVFGTAITFFLFVDTTYSHLNSFFVCTLFIYIWFRLRETEKSIYYFLLGIVGALVILVRQPDGIILILPLLDLIRKVYKREKIPLGKYFLSIIAFLILFAPQILVWKIMFGKFFVNQYSEVYFSQYSEYGVTKDALGLAALGINTPEGWQYKFSIGWYLLYQPLMVIGFVGMLLLKKKFKFYFILTFLVQFFTLMFYSTVGGLMAGRYFINLSFFILLGLCEIFKRIKRDYIYYILLGGSIIINSIFIGAIILGIPFDFPIS